MNTIVEQKAKILDQLLAAAQLSGITITLMGDLSRNENVVRIQGEKLVFFPDRTKKQLALFKVLDWAEILNTKSDIVGVVTTNVLDELDRRAQAEGGR